MTKSTITRERLEKIKSWRETYGAGSNVMLPAEEAEKLALIALAAMDSEPVAYIIQDKYEREMGAEGHLSRSHVSKYVSQEDINEHEITCTSLYRHAQPAPVVLDAATAIRACLSEFPESARDIVEECADIAENACRSAMLQDEPVTTANKLGNSPVIPDTWIPVSERMPQNDVSVLTFDGMYKRVHHAMYGHWQCWQPEKITHWMPLPAAPQEAK
ncbi:DUF551 domain-containing protein [Klebsiella aerogenes]|uniref:DUF551 domain-containing protein n=1 Tax=Klebsiella aerogenes TaxID=548 RepID=UPI003683C39C